MLIDYSSWSTWHTCPAKWYELYVNKRRPKWPSRLRDDALALGTLVHEGLQVWQESHTVEIPPHVVEKIGPTPECLRDAEELVYGYARTYPEERWPLILCEEPLRFPLTQGVEGLSKLDAFFYVPEPYIIESGQEGLQFTLSPGWWVHEYKTKGRDIPLGLFMKKWEMNMQASFQTIALQHRLQQEGHDGVVQGVLVNVLEKPKHYIPKRKCQGCEEYYEYATWLPTGTGQYSCPVCGHRQKLIPLKENPQASPPAYYRIMVTRTEEQLARARQDITLVGERMERMRQNGLYSESWNTESCTAWKRPCGYFKNHLYSSPTKEDGDMVETENYRGVEED